MSIFDTKKMKLPIWPSRRRIAPHVRRNGATAPTLRNLPSPSITLSLLNYRIQMNTVLYMGACCCCHAPPHTRNDRPAVDRATTDHASTSLPSLASGRPLSVRGRRRTRSENCFRRIKRPCRRTSACAPHDAVFVKGRPSKNKKMLIPVQTYPALP